MKRHEIRRALWLAAAPLAAGLWHAPLAGAAEPKKAVAPLIQEQLAADQAAAADQQRINKINDETREMLLQYRQYISEAKNLASYTKQLTAQVQSQVEELKFVEKQLQEIDVTSREVTPLMLKMLETLERFVELDVPFQPEERRKRVASLKEMMGRADVSISEKYRRILEAYQIELEYGRTLEAYEGRLGTGADARTVEFVRLGRVSLMYRTLDGAETGYWDADKGDWVVDNSYAHAVSEALRVARKDGAPDLLTVPVPAPQEVRS